MPAYRVSLANYKVGAVPKDRSVNTLYFTRDTALTPTQWTTFLTALYAAFNAAPIAHKSMDIRAYNMADEKPRPIVAELTQSGTDAVSGPPEVALCLSYFSERNIPSMRGRIYVGPLQGSLTGVDVPILAIVNQLVTLAGAIDAASTAAGCAWCVYSPKKDQYSPITGGWVDNAWDTQRRRGIAATTRVTYNA